MSQANVPPGTIGEVGPDGKVTPPTPSPDDRLLATTTQLGQLQEQLKQAKATVTTTAAEKAAAQEEIRKLTEQLTETKTALTTLKAALKDGGKDVDVEAIVRETRDATARDIRSAVQQDVQALQQRLDVAEAERKQVLAESKRSSAIASAAQSSGVSSELLGALVPLNTPIDEVEAKVKTSVELLKRNIPAGGGSGAGTTPQGHSGASLPAGPGTQPSSSGGNSHPSIDDTMLNARNINHADWAKNRNEILARAAARYSDRNPAGAG